MNSNKASVAAFLAAICSLALPIKEAYAITPTLNATSINATSVETITTIKATPLMIGDPCSIGSGPYGGFSGSVQWYCSCTGKSGFADGYSCTAYTTNVVYSGGIGINEPNGNTCTLKQVCGLDLQ